MALNEIDAAYFHNRGTIYHLDEIVTPSKYWKQDGDDNYYKVIGITNSGSPFLTSYTVTGLTSSLHYDVSNREVDRISDLENVIMSSDR